MIQTENLYLGTEFSYPLSPPAQLTILSFFNPAFHDYFNFHISPAVILYQGLQRVIIYPDLYDV
jgi:hypothetical protein